MFKFHQQMSNIRQIFSHLRNRSNLLVKLIIFDLQINKIKTKILYDRQKIRLFL